MTIGQRISELRKNSGFSQEFVAEKLDVSRQAVSKWETDASAPDTYNLIALSQLFGVTVEYIATGKKEERQASMTLDAPRKGVKITRIVGLILLGVGLLALILGIVLSTAVLILSVYLLLGGILCLTVKKNLFMISLWLALVLTFLLISILTTQNLFFIFTPSFYQGGINMGKTVVCLFWIWLVAAVTVTVLGILKKHQKK